jgi:hypothetical protein
MSPRETMTRFYIISQHDLEFYNFLSWKITINSSRVLVYAKLNILEENGNIIETDAFSSHGYLRRVWRYQRGNQNPYTEEEQTTQWPKEKVQKDKDKQRSTKHTYKTTSSRRQEQRIASNMLVKHVHDGVLNVYIWNLIFYLKCYVFVP